MSVHTVLKTIAFHIDAYRVIPRILVLGYGYLFWKVVFWFCSRPDVSTNQAAVIATIASVAATLFVFYVRTGRDWNSSKDDEIK